MTPEQQRIAIAKACGWKHVNVDELMSGYAPDQGMPGLCIIPNYPFDLNAMHEEEKTLTDEQYIRFAQHLNAAWFRDNPQPVNRIGLLRSASATAAQRAEAFLRTLNLWKE